MSKKVTQTAKGPSINLGELQATLTKRRKENELAQAVLERAAGQAQATADRLSKAQALFDQGYRAVRGG